MKPMARPRGTRVVRSRRFGLSRMFKRPQTYFAAALPLAIPLVLAAVTGVEPAAAPSTNFKAAAAATLRYSDLTAPSPASLPEHSMILTVEENRIERIARLDRECDRVRRQSCRRGRGQVGVSKHRTRHRVRAFESRGGGTDRQKKRGGYNSCEYCSGSL